MLALSGCAAVSAPAPTTASSQGFDDADASARELIDRLESTALDERPEGVIASVRPDALVFDDGSGERSLPMPDGEFYLSVAPYVGQTHECFFHSLTTCIGELRDTEVEVTVTDAATGDVILAEATRTADNGFVGLWLPRDIAATLTVTADGRTATTAISTGDDDPTCLTTLQLA